MGLFQSQGKLSWFGLLAMASLGCLVGVGSYTFKYAEGASYLGNDSRTCANCHIMREHYDSWQKSSHHAVAGCNDCHLPQDFVSKYLAWIPTEALAPNKGGRIRCIFPGENRIRRFDLVGFF